MGNNKGPTDEEIMRAEQAAEQARQTAKAFAPYVANNRLNPDLLKHILDNHAPGNDAVDDGVYQQPWLATDTFYRHTEEYVKPEKRLVYKMELERAFPKQKQGR